MKNKPIFNLFLAIFITTLILFPLTVLAQDDEMPAFFSKIFNEAFLVGVLAVVGFTKYIRNLVNVKGPLAVVITAVVSLAYGFIQYNAQGIPFALGVGVIAFCVSAGVFKGLKLVGKKINPEGTS